MEIRCCNMTLNATASCIVSQENTRNACSPSLYDKEPAEPTGLLLAGNFLLVTVSLLSILSTSFALRI